MATRIQIRRDTSTNWTSENPTLAVGELALETDTNKIKCGDGSSAWASLGYIAGDAHADNDKVFFGNADDLEIYHDGSNSYIKDSGTGNLIIQGDNLVLGHTNNEEAVVATSNGAVQLKHDNVTKLATSSAGVTITGTGAATTFSAATSFVLGNWTIDLDGNNLIFNYDGTDLFSLDATSSTIYNLSDQGNGFGTRTVSTSSPTGGSDGDIWYKVTL
jgi:hypothetical protein